MFCKHPQIFKVFLSSKICCLMVAGTYIRIHIQEGNGISIWCVVYVYEINCSLLFTCE